MNILFPVLFLLFSLGQLGRFSLREGLINGYLYEIPLFLLTVLLVMIHGLKPLRLAVRQWRSLAVFIGIASVSLIVSFFRYPAAQNEVAILYFIRFIVYFIYFFYLAYAVGKKRLKRLTIVWSLGLFAGITIVSSALQYLLYPDLRNLQYLGWDPHLYRMFGLFFDTSVASAVYGLIFLCAVINLDRLSNLRIHLLIIAGLTGILMFLTYSRSLYLMIFLSTGLFFLIRKQYAAIIIFVVIAFSGILLLPHRFGEGVNLVRTFSVSSRLDDYRTGIEIWRRHPVFGIGYNQLRAEKGLSGPSHASSSLSSSFLIILATTGIAGLIAFVLFIGRVASLGNGPLILTVFIAGMSFTDNILLHPFILLFYLTVIAVSSRVFDTLR